MKRKMDKSKIQSVLVPFCPPLSPSQVETIATKIEVLIAEEATKEAEAPAPKPARVKKSS
jgi:hypothetical protein